jgi:Protein of unknown function (DUF3040)
MSASAFHPDESDFLTPREKKALAEIAEDLRTSDPPLAGQLTGDPVDHLSVPPVWILHVARAAILMMPIALFVPYDWWAELGAVAVAVAAYRLLRARMTS